MVFPTVTVTWVGFSGYRIGIKNSKTCLARKSSQPLTVYPSLGFMDLLNCLTIYLSVREAHP